MKPTDCILKKMARVMTDEATLKAVRFDVQNKKISFAFEPGAESEKARKRIGLLTDDLDLDDCGRFLNAEWDPACEMCRDGGRIPLPKGIRLVGSIESGVTLEKETCPTAPKSWRWNQIPYPVRY